MTIARDPRTGAVLGQVTEPTAAHPTIPYVYPCGEETRTAHYPDKRYLSLLTRDGRYVTVPAHSVRLEEIR